MKLLTEAGTINQTSFGQNYPNERERDAERMPSADYIFARICVHRSNSAYIHLPAFRVKKVDFTKAIFRIPHLSGFYILLYGSLNYDI